VRSEHHETCCVRLVLRRVGRLIYVYWGERLIRLLAPDPNIYYIRSSRDKEPPVTTAVTSVPATRCHAAPGTSRVNIPDSSPISPRRPPGDWPPRWLAVLPVRMIRYGATVSTAIAGTPRFLALDEIGLAFASGMCWSG
jgi:hypothetical protein